MCVCVCVFGGRGVEEVHWGFLEQALMTSLTVSDEIRNVSITFRIF